jgi:hypothetical protein
MFHKREDLIGWLTCSHVSALIGRAAPTFYVMDRRMGVCLVRHPCKVMSTNGVFGDFFFVRSDLSSGLALAFLSDDGHHITPYKIIFCSLAALP